MTYFNKSKLLITALLGLFYLNFTSAQTIATIIQEDINSVGQDFTNLTIQVNGASSGITYDIHVLLNSQGIEMVNTGANTVSVTNGTLGTITGTATAPIIPVTASASSFELIVPRRATCPTYDLLSAGTATAFNDQAKIGAGGALFTPSSNYQVNYGALNITAINDASSIITTSTTVNRSVNIVQGLPGSLSVFFVEIIDTDDVLGFSNIELTGNNTVAIPAGQITTLPNRTLVRITSADMLAADFGNSNGLFNLNESVTLNYDLNMEGACPLGNTITTDHRTFWGELGNTNSTTYCQETSLNKIISFSEEVPDLSVTIDSSIPDTCLGYTANYMEHIITFENTGDADLMNLTFKIEGREEEFNSFDIDNIIYSLDGAAPTLIAPTASTDLDDRAGCLSSIPGGLNLKTEAEMSIPIDIPANSALEVILRTYSCCPTACINDYNAHSFNITEVAYAELCGGTFSETDINLNTSYFRWSSSLSAPSNFFLSDPEQYATIDIFQGDLESFLMATNATFELDVVFPDGIDLGLSGAASEITWTGGTTTVGAPTTSNVTDAGFNMTWAATDGLYTDGIIGFPLVLDCPERALGGGSNNLIVNLYIIPESGCATSDCKIQILCENTSVAFACPIPCPEGGLNHQYYAFYRSNIDEHDADNNGCPDTDNDCDGVLSGVDTDEPVAPAFDPNLVKSNRATDGDTVISEVIATVRVGSEGEFRRLQIVDNFGSNTLRNVFNFIDAQIDYTDISTGLDYSASIPVVQQTGINRYDIRPSAFGLSDANHRFQQDDTIKAVIKYVIKGHFATSSIVRSVNNYVYALPGTNLWSGPKFSCTNFAGNISHIAQNIYRLNYTNQTINGCGEAEIAADIKFDVGRTEDVQFFPYEYRRMGYVDSFTMRILDGYDFDRAGVTIDRINSSNVDTAVVVPTSIIPGIGYSDYVFDLKDPLNSSVLSDYGGSIVPGDETYMFRLLVYVTPACDVTVDVSEDFDPGDLASFAQAIRQQYWQGNAYPWTLDISREVRSRVAEMTISSLNQVESFISNDMAWDIDIRNNNSNGIAEDVWVFIETPGAIDPMSVTLHQDNSGTLNEISANANGIYELGNVGTQVTNAYQVGANVSSCVSDSLIVYMGNSCDGYPSNIAEAKTRCYERFPVYVEPEDAQISSIITALGSTPNPADGTTLYGSSDISMCAPFPVEIQIISGQLEPVNEVSLSVPSLGDGLEYVANSGYIWYDRNGDGSLDADGADNIDDGGANDDERIHFDATADGTLVSTNGTGNNFLFNIEALTSAAGLFDWSSGQYLPGVKELPKNIIYVRFEMQTTCNVVVGTPITAQIFAQKALCGGSALGDGELRSGFNLNIAGASANYTTTNNSIIQNDINDCGATQSINFNFTKSGTNAPVAEDSIVVFLPTGLVYDSFGANAGDQNVSTSPDITTNPVGQYLKWQVPAALGDNETIDFNINVIPTSNACSAFEIRMEVQTIISLTCNATSCSGSKIVVGNATDIVDVELPNFNLALNALNSTTPDQYEGGFDLSNIGITDFNDNLVVELYKYDGVGEITGAMLTSINSGTVLSGTSRSVNFSFSTTEDLSLGVVAIIPNTSNNCYCGMPDIATRSMNNTPSSFITPVLPIDLVDFEATIKDCQVSLEWTTAKEDNFSHFEVIRMNAPYAEKVIIETIPGRYPNGGTYTFLDNTKLSSGKYYYQLKNVDIDGSFEYSELITVSINCGTSSIAIIPNPVKESGEITISFFTPFEEELIQIFDINGRMVKSLTESTRPGEQKDVVISLDGLVPSIYFIRTSSGIATKFIIKP